MIASFLKIFCAMSQEGLPTFNGFKTYYVCKIAAVAGTKQLIKKRNIPELISLGVILKTSNFRFY